jgi:photosystem II stability/assembly factor-like uncharacterized protein
MAGALATIVVVGLVYLHPAFPKVVPVPRAPAPPLISDRYQVTYDFLTSTAGWALVGDQASAQPRFWVFKTTDAAKTWQRQLTGDIGAHNGGSLDIQFFDRDHGIIALGGAATAYRTQDGGGHWTPLALPPFSFASVFFADPAHGWILGTAVSPDLQTATFHFFSTSDAGDHWVALPQPPAWQFAGQGGFNNFAIRRRGEGWMGGFAQQSTVYSTIDGGITWQAHGLPVTYAKGGFDLGARPLQETSVYMLPGTGVLAVAVDENANPVGLTSFDGGSTWRRLPPPPGETAYSDFIFQDTFHWWAMRYGTLFKSSDAGQTWKEVAQQLDEWDYTPQVVDAKHAWAQMTVVFPRSNPPQGTGLATTADGGIHWTPVNVPKPS